jgi:ankyrin repeat protein
LLPPFFDCRPEEGASSRILWVLLLWLVVAAAAMDYDSPEGELFFATMTKDVEEARAAISRGANTNGANEAGMTPLHVALAGAGPGEMVELLLSAGADPGACDSQGWNGLIYAASAGQIALVEAILAHSSAADLHARTTCENGWTALKRASHRGHADIVERLLEELAVLSEEAERDLRESLELASAAEHHEIVRALSARLAPDEVDSRDDPRWEQSS